MAYKKRKVGLPPGAVVFTGHQKVDHVHLHYLKYNETGCENKDFSNQEEIIFHQSEDHTVDWYDVRGLHDTDLLESLGKTFQIHNLVLEDIADMHQRPKFDEYEDGIFIIMKALSFKKETQNNQVEQVAIFFRKGLLLSFQETESDLFAHVRKRLEASNSRIRQRGSDYLAYALMDALVDGYYPVLDGMEDRIELLEDELLSNPDASIKSKIHYLKKELMAIRKRILPLREAISRLSKSESPLITDLSLLFLRDLYDNAIQIIDILDSYRDTLNGLQDLYLSEISHRMNAVMKVLTIITTIFVPLSFLAGLYGMNFEHMPELHWRYGYFGLLAVMLIITILLIGYFRRKNWL